LHTLSRIEGWAMKTILVADDQPVMRLVVRAMLGSNPAYQVREAENGVEALALAREHRPDVVLLDVEMPKMTGPEVCLLLKGSSETRDIPVLLMSGREQEDVQGYALMARADDFFRKPFMARALLGRMKALLGE
jgi:two-component system, OmpR family, phosphate regulon response regulator PhoB